MKSVLMILAALAVVCFFRYDYYQSLPPNREARGKVVSFVNSERHVNALQLGDETQGIVPKALADRKVSSQQELNTVLASGTRANNLNNVLAAWDARESGRSISHVEAEVSGDQHSPNWVADAYEALHVWTDPSEKMTLLVDRSVQSGPDGLEVDDEYIQNHYLKDQTTLMFDRIQQTRPNPWNQYKWMGNDCHAGVCNAIIQDMFSQKTYPLPNTGKIFELIAQVCPKDSNAPCTELEPAGSNFYVCGGHPGGSLHLGINRTEVGGNELNTGNRWDLDGKWKINIEYGDPEAARTCAENPNLTIIPLSETPVLPSVIGK